MKGNGGFTLIELILVTVIIGILAAAVVPMFGGRVTDAQISRAKGDIASLSGAIDLYALDNNDTYPRSLSELVTGERKYIREMPIDPWGREYIYKPGTDTRKADYQIFSAGPNGVPGDGDDVTSTSPMP